MDEADGLLRDADSIVPLRLRRRMCHVSISSLALRNSSWNVASGSACGQYKLHDKISNQVRGSGRFMEAMSCHEKQHQMLANLEASSEVDADIVLPPIDRACGIKLPEQLQTRLYLPACREPRKPFIRSVLCNPVPKFALRFTGPTPFAASIGIRNRKPWSTRPRSADRFGLLNSHWG
jgi:hypothetical protein